MTGTVGTAPYSSDPFAIPSVCTKVEGDINSLFTTILPTVSTVLAQPSTQEFPPLPIMFEALIEAKLSDELSQNT
jgi:hypothetical protein